MRYFVLPAFVALLLVACQQREAPPADVPPPPAPPYEQVPNEPHEANEPQRSTYSDYREGVIDGGEPIVLFFHAAWCPYCQRDDAMLRTWYDDGGFPISVYKVDYDTASDLKVRFGVVQQSTFVRLDGDGNIVRTVSFPSPDILKNLLQ